MRNDRKINVSFSASADDVIRRFMKVAERTMPNASLVPIILWSIGGTFTNKVTGEVKALGPGVGVGAIDLKELTDELVVPMGGLRSQFDCRKNCNLTIDFSDNSFVVADH